MALGIVGKFGPSDSFTTASGCGTIHLMDKYKAIQTLLDTARPKILKEYRADSCIASTAICVDVLTRLGILAEPLAVRLMIFNQPFVARIEQTGIFPKGDEIKEWTAEDGSYSVGIGFGPAQPGKWPGHLVAIAEKKYLIDISVDQANRPIYGMEFKPIFIEVEEEFFSGTPRVFSYNGCTFRYDAIPQNLGYQSSPDWTFAGRRTKIVESTLSEMEYQ